MASLPDWTDEVSDLVMDAQVIAMKAVDEDGVLTENEQRMLDALVAAQRRIMVVHDEILNVTSTLRSGQRPRRLLRAMAQSDEPDAA